MTEEKRECENCKIGKLCYLEEYAIADLYRCQNCGKIYKWFGGEKEETNF